MFIYYFCEKIIESDLLAATTEAFLVSLESLESSPFLDPKYQGGGCWLYVLGYPGALEEADDMALLRVFTPDGDADAAAAAAAALATPLTIAVDADAAALAAFCGAGPLLLL